MLGIYIVLTMVLNYEVVGSARWEALKSFHHLGIAMLILYGLLLYSRGEWHRLALPRENRPVGSSRPISEVQSN